MHVSGFSGLMAAEPRNGHHGNAVQRDGGNTRSRSSALATAARIDGPVSSSCGSGGEGVEAEEGRKDRNGAARGGETERKPEMALGVAGAAEAALFYSFYFMYDV